MHSKISHLLILLSATEGVEVLVQTMKEQLPPGIGEWIGGKMDMDEMRELVIPLYEEQFTEADIDGMIAFFESPLGQKYLTGLKNLGPEASKAGVRYMEQVLETNKVEFEALMAKSLGSVFTTYEEPVLDDI